MRDYGNSKHNAILAFPPQILLTTRFVVKIIENCKPKLFKRDYIRAIVTYALYKKSLEKKALFGHLANHALLDTDPSVPDYLVFLWSL